jgi:hypothetical protein
MGEGRCAVVNILGSGVETDGYHVQRPEPVMGESRCAGVNILGLGLELMVKAASLLGRPVGSREEVEMQLNF